MEDFMFWAETGFFHILDWAGYDHMLFLLSLCCVFTFKDWKWLWLVSAFTIGHAISLSLSVLDVVRLPSAWVEAMIPATIALSCLNHLFPIVFSKRFDVSPKSNSQTHLTVAMVFGLIHGLGFSNFLRSMLGRELSILKPLLYFHVGLEVGQILIIFVVLLLTTALSRLPEYNKSMVVAAISVPVLLISLWMLLQRLGAF